MDKSILAALISVTLMAVDVNPPTAINVFYRLTVTRDSLTFSAGDYIVLDNCLIRGMEYKKQGYEFECIALEKK